LGTAGFALLAIVAIGAPAAALDGSRDAPLAGSLDPALVEPAGAPLDASPVEAPAEPVAPDLPTPSLEVSPDQGVHAEIPPLLPVAGLPGDGGVTVDLPPPAIPPGATLPPLVASATPPAPAPTAPGTAGGATPRPRPGGGGDPSPGDAAGALGGGGAGGRDSRAVSSHPARVTGSIEDGAGGGLWSVIGSAATSTGPWVVLCAVALVVHATVASAWRDRRRGPRVSPG
jgi:hypothetical protein